MRIAIFSDFFYPEISGVTDSVLLLGKELARRGHQIMFVVPRYSKKNYVMVKGENRDNFGPNIIVRRLLSFGIPFSPTKQNRAPLPFGFGIYWVKKFKPDIIHTHSPLEPGYEAWLASKLFNIPLVGTNHTPIGEFISGPKWYVNTVSRRFCQFYNKCSFVTTPSQYLLDYMRNFGLTQKGQPLSNPMDTASFAPVKNEAEKIVLKKQFGFSAKTVIYTGRLAEEKHVDDIIRAVALVKEKIPDISLAITGHGKAEKKLFSLVEELKIKDWVKFLGFVDEKTYPLIYKASDIFAIMSTAESQSISLILAMASGLPVIGANARALPEFISKENGVVVEIGDYKTLAQEIIKIFSNPDLAKNLGAGGLATAAKYSAPVIAKEWEGIYKRVIDQEV